MYLVKSRFTIFILTIYISKTKIASNKRPRPCANSEGVAGGPYPPAENYKTIGFVLSTPEKAQKYQANIPLCS